MIHHHHHHQHLVQTGSSITQALRPKSQGESEMHIRYTILFPSQLNLPTNVGGNNITIAITPLVVKGGYLRSPD
jgi:hypothetical protein